MSVVDIGYDLRPEIVNLRECGFSVSNSVCLIEKVL